MRRLFFILALCVSCIYHSMAQIVGEGDTLRLSYYIPSPMPRCDEGLFLYVKNNEINAMAIKYDSCSVFKNIAYSHDKKIKSITAPSDIE